MRLQNVLKGRALAAHHTHALPLQRALLATAEVLVSTAGPAASGADAGAQKGRGQALAEWHGQQELLRAECVGLSGRTAAPAKAQAGDTMPRRLSALAAAGGTPWQAEALGRFHTLRERQQALESRAHVRAHLMFSLCDRAAACNAARY